MSERATFCWLVSQACESGVIFGCGEWAVCGENRSQTPSKKGLVAPSGEGDQVSRE